MGKSLEIFRNRLMALTAERGSLTKLARAAGLDPAVISKYNKQEIKPSLEAAEKIAEAAGMTLVEFLTDPNKPTAPPAAIFRQFHCQPIRLFLRDELRKTRDQIDRAVDALDLKQKK